MQCKFHLISIYWRKDSYKISYYKNILKSFLYLFDIVFTLKIKQFLGFNLSYLSLSEFCLEVNFKGRIGRISKYVYLSCVYVCFAIICIFEETKVKVFSFYLICIDLTNARNVLLKVKSYCYFIWFKGWKLLLIVILFE